MPELLTRAWAASPRNAGRNHLGRVGGIISESGAASPWNAGRLELGTHTRGLLAVEGDRQALERSFALIQHNLESGINTLRVQFSEPRNTAEARIVARALQRLSKARLIFNEDESDLTRFADREQGQPKRHEFYAKPTGPVVERRHRRAKKRA